jgi:hypothetical protein
MSGVRLLHAVNRQRSNRVDAQLIHVFLRLRLTHVLPQSSIELEISIFSPPTIFDAPPDTPDARFFFPSVCNYFHATKSAPAGDNRDCDLIMEPVASQFAR